MSADLMSVADMPDDEVQSRWWSGDLSVRGRTEFRVFSPPASWRVSPDGRQELLRPREYTLWLFARGKHSGVRGSHVDFTEDDLANLGPGQAWTNDGPISLKDFDERIAHKC